MIKQIGVIFFTILVMTGCTQMVNQNGVTGVSPNNTSFYTQKKIGYIINVKPYPTHTHIGTTKMTNFTKVYKYDWKIPQYTEAELVKNLKRLAYVTPINLQKYGVRANNVNGMLRKVNGKWSVVSDKQNVYNDLANRLGLYAIIVINEAPKVGIVDCGILGCKEYKAQGYGLLTKGFLTTTDYYSATPFWVHIYKLKPTPISLDPQIVNINGSKKMTKVAISKNHKMLPNKIGLKSYPKDFRNWTEAEFAPFRLPLLSYIDGMTKEVSNALLNNL
jgi:hypothetical protein